MPCLRCSDGRGSRRVWVPGVARDFCSPGRPPDQVSRSVGARQLTWERPGTRSLPGADRALERPPACPRFLGMPSPQPYRCLSSSRVWVLAADTGRHSAPVSGTSCARPCLPAHRSFLPTYGNKRGAVSRAALKMAEDLLQGRDCPRSSPHLLHLCAPGPQGRDRLCGQEWRAMAHPREAGGRHLTW